MECPKCGANNDRVVDKRPQSDDGLCDWRRRECISCLHRWNTLEISVGSLTKRQVEQIRFPALQGRR